MMGALSFPAAALSSSKPYISGHGINFSVGNKYLSETDTRLSAPVGSGLKFTRAYNSSNSKDGVLGYGWTFPYGSRLTHIDQIIAIATPTGRNIYFTTSDEVTWTNGTGKVNTITRTEDGGYRLEQPSGTVIFFDGEGLLTSKQFLDGSQLSYTYNGELLTRVANTWGQELNFSYDGAGRLMTVIAPTGAFSYTYDENSNLASVTKPGNITRQYIYDDPNDIHNLTGIIDENNERVLTLTYDTSDRVLTSALQNSSDQITIGYPSANERTITDSDGVVSTYQLEVQQGVYAVTSFTGPGCSACGADTGSEYLYNARQQITQSTDAKGNITTYSYDARGNRIQKIEAVGTALERTTTYTYDPATNKIATITEETENGERVTSSTYDASGNLLSQTATGTVDQQSVNLTTTYTYDEFGRVLTVDGPRTDVNDVNTLSYYANESEQGANRGYLNTVSDALGNTTIYSQYNAFGRPERIQSPTVETVFTYDDAGRPLTKISNGLTLFTNSYDAAGRITQSNLPEGRVITYQYADNGKPSSVVDSLGNSIVYEYDSKGKKIREDILDPEGVLQRFVEYAYEETGELDKTSYPDGSIEDLNYDPVGNLVTRIDPLGRATSYSYDALNRLTQTTAPDGTVTAYGYDKQNNTVSVTDGEGRSTLFAYDGLGRKISRTSPDTGTTLYSYDSAGNLLSATDANGVTVQREYDVLNRLVAVHYPDASQDVSYTYDENGFIGQLTTVQDSAGTTTYSYDSHGRLIQESRTLDSQVLVTDYSYNDNSELVGIIYPSGRLITYERNNSGGITSVSSTYNDETVVLAQGMTYLPFGPRTAMTLGSSLSQSKSYDQLYRLTRSTTGTVYDREYSYTLDSQVAAITNLAEPTKSQDFSYDAQNRLVGATGNYGQLAYNYDTVGSRVSETRDGLTSSYSYTAGSNRLAQVVGTEVTDFSYDAVGNTIAENDTSLSYDQSNRVTSVAVQGQNAALYSYDSRNLRVKRTTDGKTSYAAYDQAGQLIAEIDDQGQLLYEYVYLDSTLLNMFSYVEEPELISCLDDVPEGGEQSCSGQIFTGPVLYYFVNDHLGTPQMVVDETGQVAWQGDYLPFGEVQVVVDQVGNSIRFPGQYLDDETGLHYNWNRYYNPAIGRYISADPIGLDGGINLFAYVGGDPINGIDPWGLRKGWGFSAHFFVGGMSTHRVYDSCCNNGKIVERTLAVNCLFIGPGLAGGSGARTLKEFMFTASIPKPRPELTGNLETEGHCGEQEWTDNSGHRYGGDLLIFGKDSKKGWTFLSGAVGGYWRFGTHCRITVVDEEETDQCCTTEQ
jgi:RHS repeat-associated protein